MQDAFCPLLQSPTRETKEPRNTGEDAQRIAEGQLKSPGDKSLVSRLTAISQWSRQGANMAVLRTRTKVPYDPAEE